MTNLTQDQIDVYETFVKDFTEEFPNELIMVNLEGDIYIN